MTAFLRTKCRSQWQEARQFLSFFDLVRFCRYLAVIDEQKEAANQKKNNNNLRLLFQHRFGNQTSFKQNNIVNLSDYKLSDTEQFVLSHGLSFCLPPSSVKREETLADFEVLYAQLKHHKPRSEEQLAALKSRLSDLAHAYCGSPIDLGDFLMTKECFQAIKSLRTNEEILITKPDKGAGVVILSKKSYIEKMMAILSDKTKFLDLGPAANNDNTARIESKIQRRLLQLKKESLISQSVYEAIRPTGSQRPRMYGLPKVHKKDVPLRPILSMTGSSQHQLAKWLTSLLQPVLLNLSSNCILDSFTFVNEVKNFTFSPSSVFLCSFDISSLFTNVPLAETINICADALYSDESMTPSFPRSVFVELMQLATSSVEFSFNNNMHRQIDGVAMGSPLGPALANIFVGHQEAKLFANVERPLAYFRYVDDTFAAFNNEEDCNIFLSHLNSLHPSLRFTYEKESNHSLPFLDVLVERQDSKFLTSVYRKPTFTGNYLRWNSFSPKKRKINLIGTLVHRAFLICSKSKLESELGKIRSILLQNGYPDDVINSTFKQKLKQLQSNPVHTAKKCPVYLHIPWIGDVSMRFEKQITSAVKRCFFSVEPRVVFTTRQLLPTTKKDVLPSHHHSNVIYQFVCHCDSRYVGRTSQRLEERIKQHVPKSISDPPAAPSRQILSRSCKTNKITPRQFHESAIGQHLFDNAECARHYNCDKFSILARGRSLFHLSALEATFIKSLNPLLCKQKEFVYSLKLS